MPPDSQSIFGGESRMNDILCQPQSNLVEGHFLSRELVGEVWDETQGKAPDSYMCFTALHLELQLIQRGTEGQEFRLDRAHFPRSQTPPASAFSRVAPDSCKSRNLEFRALNHKRKLSFNILQGWDVLTK